jgi:hypothetical protein
MDHSVSHQAAKERDMALKTSQVGRKCLNMNSVAIYSPFLDSRLAIYHTCALGQVQRGNHPKFLGSLGGPGGGVLRKTVPLKDSSFKR